MTVRLVAGEVDAAQINCALRQLDKRIEEVARTTGSVAAPVNITDLARQVAAFIGSSGPPAGSLGQLTFGVPPVAIGTALAEGSSLNPARADHVHTMGRYRVRAYNAGTQSIPDATVTTVTMDSDEFDPQGLHDTVTDNSRITLTQAGVYLIGAGIIFEANATGVRSLRILVNTGGFFITNQSGPASAAAPCRLTCATLWDVTANDYFEAAAFHTAGAPINIQGRTSQQYAGSHIWAVGPFN